MCAFHPRASHPGACRPSVAHLRPAASSLLILAIAGCAPAPPDLSVRDEYARRRSMVVDTTKPCGLKAFPPFKFHVVHDTIILPVAVNGAYTIGVMDTGAVGTLITPELAAAAKLQLSDRTRSFIGVIGSFQTHAALVKELDFGSVSITGTLPVSVTTFGRSHGADIGANIGLDVLSNFDYDMDLPHGIIRPYRVENCFAIDPPWPNTYTGLPLTRGATDGLRRDEIDFATTYGELYGVSLPITFPGGTLEAEFDTGSMSSAMSYEGARSIGISSSALDADPFETVVGLNRRGAKFRVHHFPEMIVGEDVLHDVPIDVTRHFDRRDTWPMLLGMDYIEHHHLWLSYSTNALYIDSGEKKPAAPAQVSK
jgi:predicted aspartyl protease